MNQNEILETINCTPTWQSLLIPMLDLYAIKRRKSLVSLPSKRQQYADEMNAILIEFKNMAAAADKWNQHCKDVATK